MFLDHKRLLPTKQDQALGMKAQELLRLERALFSVWMQWLTGGNSPRTKMAFTNTLNEVEAELQASQGGDFFLGKDVSLVDLMFTPFLERIAASMIFFKGFPIRVTKGEKTDYPAINKWFDVMETLESYQLTKGDYYSHVWDLPPQLGGCTYDAPGEPFERVINGERTLDGTRGSWELPLDAHSQGVEPDWDFLGQDEDTAKREAVERLSFNHKAIVGFAARGAGRKGMPGVSAPLSDPNAVPNDAVIGSVDASLKIVSLAMMDGVESANDAMLQVASLIAKEDGNKMIGDVVASLSYLRDRIGVPRDMRLPAARQFRAHLNWSIAILLDKKV
jgi:glutathione S-transferase